MSGYAGCCPRCSTAIAVTVRSIVVVCCAAVPAVILTPVLAGRILLPRAVTVIVTGCVDCFHAWTVPQSQLLLPITVACAGRVTFVISTHEWLPQEEPRIHEP